MNRNLAYLSAWVVLSSASAALATTYDFLPIVTGSNTSTVFNSQFTSLNGNGVINVTDTFVSPAGPGYAENNNALVYPSAFPINFPGSGNVPGHLGMTVYNNTGTFYFDTSSYIITPQTVFGMWNISNEVSQPVGGNPVYRMQLLIGNTLVNPTTLTVFGKEDNVGSAGVNGQQEIDMNPLNGVITPGATINGGVGIHTSATFWNNIPTATQAIIIYADLPPLNTIGDGVGYYFAEVQVPEPASLTIFAAGTLTLLRKRRRTAVSC